MDGSEGKSGPDTFDRAYVESLRAEAAKHRVNSRRADALAMRLVLAIAEGTGHLADPTDLALTAELLPDLMDDDGLPDRAKVHELIARTLAAKPHLGRVRPIGDVGQGVGGTAETGPGWGPCCGRLRDR